MQAIGYYLLLPLLWLIAALPFKALYRLSDFLFFLVFRVFGYRKKVVFENLRNSFPEKPADEINRIAERFYRYLCDLILESLKTLKISEKEASQRCKVKNLELLEKLRTYPHSIAVMGHTGNWEWACSKLGLLNMFEALIAYKPLSNKYFDGMMLKLRSRFGSVPVSMKDTFRQFRANGKRAKLLNLVADQTPSAAEAEWLEFLNQDTAVLKGPERIARLMNCPVIYVSMSRPGRGYYELNLELMTEQPAKLPENELTEMFFMRLERDIRSTPWMWLWSHRRWKHKRSKPS